MSLELRPITLGWLRGLSPPQGTGRPCSCLGNVLEWLHLPNKNNPVKARVREVGSQRTSVVTAVGVKQGSIRDNVDAALLAQWAGCLALHSGAEEQPRAGHGFSRVCPGLFGLLYQSHH